MAEGLGGCHGEFGVDEFQTWYAGLPDKDPKTGLLMKQYASNFIQILSEIAADRPEITYEEEG
jgi:hypothetical protein